MKFNVNEYVRVKLTDRGRKVHRENYLRDMREMITSYPYTPPAEDADGWSRWQLWVLIQEFGAVIHNGCNLPFETEIEIPTQGEATDGK